MKFWLGVTDNRWFEFKTGCDVYPPQLQEPPSQLRKIGRAIAKFGGGLLVNEVSKWSGIG
ncbi:MAG: hypothetical protein EPN49_15410 [Rhodanobacter sp.]|nr:MAG: hypothetical protein EPN49_15410 [Rhodanobacter sp.]